MIILYFTHFEHFDPSLPPSLQTFTFDNPPPKKTCTFDGSPQFTSSIVECSQFFPLFSQTFAHFFML